MNLPDKVNSFLKTVQEAGFLCFVVGGSVRDALLERDVKDWDFTTSATPEEIQKIFPESFYDNSYGTVGVKMEPEIFEITPFRKEGKYSDLRHPDQIEWAKTLEEDLGRRDFTINAIATDGKKIIDPFDGQADLKNKLIRAVGDPDKRFQEDALRLMRAIRIATQLGFTIEEKTWAAIWNNAALIQNVSSERIRDELVKILASDYPADGIKLLDNAGILEYILPELVRGKGVDQHGTHHTDDVFDHSIKALAATTSEKWLVRFATLIHDIGKSVTYRERNGKATFYNHELVGANIARQIAERLHFSKEDREKLWMLVRWHMFSVSEFLSDSAIRRFIKRVGTDNTTDILDLRTADRLGSGSTKTSWRHEDFKKRIIEVQKHVPSVADLKVNGKDVMEVLGIPAGPKVGEILNKLFEEISEDPSKNDREYLIKRTGEIGL
jgi:tRNA nucleotidyltransferase (CCA-adding enzyme)